MSYRCCHRAAVMLQHILDEICLSYLLSSVTDLRLLEVLTQLGTNSSSPSLNGRRPVSDPIFVSPISISPRNTENLTSPASSPNPESPKRSPSKQFRNFARAIRSSVATDKSN